MGRRVVGLPSVVLAADRELSPSVCVATEYVREQWIRVIAPPESAGAIGVDREMVGLTLRARVSPEGNFVVHVADVRGALAKRLSVGTMKRVDQVLDHNPVSVIELMQKESIKALPPCWMKRIAFSCCSWNYCVAWIPVGEYITFFNAPDGAGLAVHVRWLNGSVKHVFARYID